LEVAILPNTRGTRLRSRGRNSAWFLLFFAIRLPGWAQTTAPWLPKESEFRFHMIGQAHIDPVWLWPWSEGLSASSAQFYEWVAGNDPAMLAEIRKRVEEGRWDAVGGWWVEPDVNVPNGESLVRQGLYGQLTFRRNGGARRKRLDRIRVCRKELVWRIPPLPNQDPAPGCPQRRHTRGQSPGGVTAR